MSQLKKKRLRIRSSSVFRQHGWRKFWQQAEGSHHCFPQSYLPPSRTFCLSQGSGPSKMSPVRSSVRCGGGRPGPTLTEFTVSKEEKHENGCKSRQKNLFGTCQDVPGEHPMNSKGSKRNCHRLSHGGSQGGDEAKANLQQERGRRDQKKRKREASHR